MRRVGVFAVSLALCIFLSRGGADARTSARCGSPSGPTAYRTCQIGRYNVQFSGTMTATRSGETQTITVAGSLKGVRADGDRARVRIRGRTGRFTTLGFRSTYGRGSFTSTLHLSKGDDCTFAKTYQRSIPAFNQNIEGGLVLGWRPTLAEMRRGEGGGVGNLDLLLGDPEFDPPITNCADYDGFTVGDAFAGLGIGTCGPEGWVRNCLVVSPFTVKFTAQPGRQVQTLRRLTFPINRLWAHRSFTLSGRKTAPWFDGTIESEARITFTPRS